MWVFTVKPPKNQFKLALGVATNRSSNQQIHQLVFYIWDNIWMHGPFQKLVWNHRQLIPRALLELEIGGYEIDSLEYL